MRWPLLLSMAIGLLPAVASAQMAGDEAKVCVPNGASPNAEYERDNQAKEWPEEARRFRGDVPNVARNGDRLRLSIDGGKSVELQDCPYGDAAYQYLYERFDDPGRFYVIRKPANEDFSYTLVMKRTGRLFTVYGAPVWASDKSRFLSVACSLVPERGTLTIYAASGEGLVPEAEIPLPCNLQSCSARWDFQSWIAVSCTPRDEPGKKATEFVVMRGNDGKWNRFGR
jgi:hypothetical protein